MMGFSFYILWLHVLVKYISLKEKGRCTCSKILIGYYINYSRMCILICRIKVLICAETFFWEHRCQILGKLIFRLLWGWKSWCAGSVCIFFFLVDQPSPDIDWWLGTEMKIKIFIVRLLSSWASLLNPPMLCKFCSN